MFRIVYFAFLSAVLVFTLYQISCGPEHGPPPVLFDLEMTTNWDTYAPGETVTANISFTNIYGKDFTVKPFPPTVLVEKMGTGLPVSPVVASFPGIEEERLLHPSESVNWSVSWDQRDQEGNQVSPGQYIFELEFTTVRNGHVTQWGAPGSIIKIEAAEE